MAARNAATCDMLLRGFAHAAHNKYGARIQICMIKYTDSYQDVFLKYMSAPRPNSIYEADIKERDEKLSGFEPVESFNGISSFAGAIEKEEESDFEVSVDDLL